MRSNRFAAEHRVLVLAPTSRDAEHTHKLLEAEGIHSVSCADMNAICQEMLAGADAAIVTEEAILTDRTNQLEKVLTAQPPWSDFPLIVLKPAARDSAASMAALAAIGNMTLLTRPVGISTLLSHVRTALRDRRRQYKLREYLNERDQQANILEETRDHLSLMLESAHDFAILSMDQSGQIISWNKGSERIFGYTAEEAIGQPFEIIFTDEDRAAQTPAYEMQQAASFEYVPDERWHRRKNGDRFYASGTLAAMKTDKGVKGFIKIAHDRTLQKAAEESVIASRNAAEAASLAKSEFLANMSHEIRTPMNAVFGISSILSRTSPLTEKQAEYIKTLQLSADALLALINDLLDISKIESRSVELEQVPFSIVQLVDSITEMLSVKAKEKGITFTTAYNCDHSQKHLFVGDPTRLRQILTNLCSNAIKFTEEGDVKIAVTCHKGETPETQMVTFDITDTGIGIAPENLETIFQKFVQADSSINRKYGGTGLGLAITKTLTEIMGGKIKVQSELGKGSCFSISVPFKIARKEDVNEFNGSLDDVLADSQVVSIKSRILLVEDYLPNVIVAEAFLDEFGYTCETASNGIEAVEKFANGGFDLILMDVQMHGMNGLEATQHIRTIESQQRLPRIPIIGMTAHALAGDKQRCIDAGMDDYISKPFEPANFEKTLKAFLEAA